LHEHAKEQVRGRRVYIVDSIYVEGEDKHEVRMLATKIWKELSEIGFADADEIAENIKRAGSKGVFRCVEGNEKIYGPLIMYRCSRIVIGEDSDPSRVVLENASIAIIMRYMGRGVYLGSRYIVSQEVDPTELVLKMLLSIADYKGAAWLLRDILRESGSHAIKAVKIARRYIEEIYSKGMKTAAEDFMKELERRGILNEVLRY